MLISHFKNPRSLKNYDDSTLCSMKGTEKKGGGGAKSTPVYNVAYQIFLSTLLRPAAQKKMIPLKILMLVDNVPGHLRALISIFNVIHFVRLQLF